MPVMPDEFVKTITERYIELYELVTGSKFSPDTSEDIKADINQVF